MSTISLQALPTAEKQAAAIDLSRDHNPTQIAEILGVGWHRVKKWIDPSHAASLRERERERMRKKRGMVVRASQCDCDCADALIDPQADRYFRRSVHCVYCGKAVKR